MGVAVVRIRHTSTSKIRIFYEIQLLWVLFQKSTKCLRVIFRTRVIMQINQLSIRPIQTKKPGAFFIDDVIWWVPVKNVSVSNDSLWNITFHFCSLVWVSTEYFSIVNMISDSSFWPSWHGMICFIVLVDCANAQKPSVPCFLNEHLQCMWANYDTSLVCCPHPNYKKAIKKWLCTLLPADSFHLKLSYVRCCAE